MTIQDLGSLGELIGSVAVLATLVYLALQTRQNTLAIAAQVDAARMNISMSLNMAIASSDGILDAMVDDKSETSTNTVNSERLDCIWRMSMLNFQWQFIHGRRGLLPTRSDEQMAQAVRSFFTDYRSVERWWRTFGVNLVPEFVEWVEEQRHRAA